MAMFPEEPVLPFDISNDVLFGAIAVLVVFYALYYVSFMCLLFSSNPSSRRDD